MSASVTPGPLGGIPATTNVYTAAQMDERISGLERLINASPEEIAETIAAITQVTSGFATRAELCGVVQDYCGELVLASGVESGSGVSGVVYNKHGHGVRLLDESMVSGSLSGVEMFSSGMSMLSHLLDSGYTAFRIEDGVDAAAELYGGFSGIGLSGVFSAVSSLVGAVSGGGSGSVPVVVPSGTSLCDAVQGCVAEALCGLGGRVSELEGDVSVLENCCAQVSSVDFSGLASAISGLRAEIGGIGSGLSAIWEEISGLPNAIITAINEAPEPPDNPEPLRSAKRKIEAAKDPDDPDDGQKNGIVSPPVQDMNDEIDGHVDDIEEALEDASDSLSDISDATAGASSGTSAEEVSEEASEASQTAADEASAVQAIGDFVP